MQEKIQSVPSAYPAPKDSALVIEVLRTIAAPLTGDAYLHNLVQQLGSLFQAETTFVAHRADAQSTKVRGVAAWKDGALKDTWEFDLRNNPCHMVYRGEPIFLPCDVAEKFSGKKDSGYESFVGYPLHGRDGRVMGHIAVYSSKILEEDDAWVSICQLFAERAEAELQRQQFEDELERTVEKLKELDALKNEFISVAAHDLRSPLGAIRGMAEVLGRRGLGGEREQVMLGNIVDGADRMVGLVNRYLDYAAIEAGALKLERVSCDLSALLGRSLTLRRVIAAERDISIDVEAPDTLMWYVDPDRICQVIDNFLDNAIKFSPDGGKILLKASIIDNGAKVSIAVEDEGPGVPEEIRERMFDAFETSGHDVEGEKIRTRKSFGLGLMISKRVIDSHGGQIVVGTSRLGGARIAAILPAA